MNESDITLGPHTLELDIWSVVTDTDDDTTVEHFNESEKAYLYAFSFLPEELQNEFARDTHKLERSFTDALNKYNGDPSYAFYTDTIKVEKYVWAVWPDGSWKPLEDVL